MKEFLDHIIHEFELPLANPVLVFSLILLIILLAGIENDITDFKKNTFRSKFSGLTDFLFY